jgi:hypothetical protein
MITDGELDGEITDEDLAMARDLGEATDLSVADERELADELAMAREFSDATGLSVSEVFVCILEAKRIAASTPLQLEVMRRKALEKQIKEAERKAEQDRRDRFDKQVNWGFFAAAAVVIALIALSQRPQPEAYDGQFDGPREFIR